MTATFYVGDAVTVMNTLPEKSVDLILTSPPFLALRSYLPQDHPDKALEGGSQATPGAYIDWLLEVVEACARVLARHGSLCFELGDTYSGGGQGPDARYAAKEDQVLYNPTKRGMHAREPGRLARYADDRGNPDGMRDTTFSGGNTKTGGGDGWPLAKSLSLIPETFRFAMVYGVNPHTGRRTEPWRLRNVIRWVRPNPPVGALGDKFRPATSELMVFCKSKDRFFDLDAVREPHQTQDTRAEVRYPRQMKGRMGTDGENNASANGNNPAGAPPLDWWNIPPGGYPGAHYAVWPPELLVKPIKAMVPERVCRVCSRPSERIVAKTTEYAAFRASKTGVELTDARKAYHLAEKGGAGSLDHREDSGARGQLYETTGFSDCGHDDYRPGLVLDPFAGSGTTLAVATGHGRDAVGIDLDERNYELALDRVGPLVLSRAA